MIEFRKWIKVLTPLVFICLIVIILGVTYSKSNDLKNIFTTKYEINYVNVQHEQITPNNELINIINTNNKNIEILKSDIKRIEDINDKRFELLGWGLGFLIITLSVLFAITYFHSKSEAIDVINSELEGRNSDYNKEYSELISKIKDDITLVNKELTRIRDIK